MCMKKQGVKPTHGSPPRAVIFVFVRGSAQNSVAAVPPRLDCCRGLLPSDEGQLRTPISNTTAPAMDELFHLEGRKFECAPF